jgi:hypothetical protein
MRRAAKKGVIYALMRYEHPNLRWHRHYTNHLGFWWRRFAQDDCTRSIRCCEIVDLCCVKAAGFSFCRLMDTGVTNFEVYCVSKLSCCVYNERYWQNIITTVGRAIGGPISSLFRLFQFPSILWHNFRLFGEMQIPCSSVLYKVVSPAAWQTLLGD